MNSIKALLIVLFSIAALFSTGCETQVAVDPNTGVDQTARYQAGFFFGMVEGELADTFRTTIQTLDDMGYFRTGERHEETYINIYARKVGDEKISLRLKQTPEEGILEMRIRVGNLGNLAESQTIYAHVIDAL